MSHRYALPDADWARVEHLLPGRRGQHGGVAADNRRFVDAVLWVARTGAAWRDLPERLGRWNSAWRRFDRWAARGAWARVMDALRDPDLGWLILDSTSVRAHPLRRRGAGRGGDQALGRSRGGFGTKVHASVGPLKHPVELVLTGGQAADVKQAEALLAGHRPAAVIADAGYDSDALIATIEGRGAEAVVKPNRCRRRPRAIDRHLYRERNVAERLWSKVKQYRRVATRYDKKAANFLAFVRVALVMVILQ